MASLAFYPLGCLSLDLAPLRDTKLLFENLDSKDRMNLSLNDLSIVHEKTNVYAFCYHDYMALFDTKHKSMI